ncbi:hypothetical protein BC332_13553 [Capsicum chinense]|nr:hypothetical protein BC332_13553 [Capsicum chinense]
MPEGEMRRRQFVVAGSTNDGNNGGIEIHKMDGPRSWDFWRWRNTEDIDPRSKYVIPKLIQKLGEIENLVESCHFNEVEKLIGLNKSIEEGSEEVNKPKESKHDDNRINTKLEKLEEEIQKIKEKEK